MRRVRFWIRPKYWDKLPIQKPENSDHKIYSRIQQKKIESLTNEFNFNCEGCNG